MNEGELLPEKHRNRYRHKYQDTSRRMTGFFTLMSHWRGSVLKLIYHNLIIFCVLYALLSVLYRAVLLNRAEQRQREVFELLCIYAARFQSYIPLNFLIGFYVQQVVSRWWNTFTALPFPDKIALKLVSFVPGKEPFKRNLRRTVMRYVNLSTLLVYRLVSGKVKMRFPTMDSLVEAKLLLPHEADRLEKVDFRTPHEATWAPVLWALNLLCRARQEGKITLEPPVWANMVTAFEYVEDCNRKVLNYGWIEFPLAYTQVATFSVYAYFTAALFGRQFLEPRGEHNDNTTFPAVPNMNFAASGPFANHTPDVYIPIFTIVEFISYLGWIKVAETLLNPFGDDDEDFEVNYLIDRNLQVSYLIVDEADNDMDMEKDPFLEAGISVPDELPYLSDEKIVRTNSMRSISSIGPIHKKHSVSLISVNRIKEALGAPSSPSTAPARRRGVSEGQQHSPRLPHVSHLSRQNSQTSLGRPEVIRNGFVTPSFSPKLRHQPLSDLLEVDHEYDASIQKAEEGQNYPSITADTFNANPRQGNLNTAFNLDEEEKWKPKI